MLSRVLLGPSSPYKAHTQEKRTHVSAQDLAHEHSRQGSVHSPRLTGAEEGTPQVPVNGRADTGGVTCPLNGTALTIQGKQTLQAAAAGTGCGHAAPREGGRRARPRVL